MTDMLLRGVVGSTVYGLGHAGSDIDRLGVFIAPRWRVLGFGLHAWEKTRRQHDPDPHDTAEHEVEKYLRLALRCNPTAIELLWLPEYEVLTPWGQALVNTREAFLSTEAVHAAYGGYAADQAERLRQAHRFPDVPRSRIEKHGRHCLRLLLQGRELLLTGRLPIVLTPDEVGYVRHMGGMALGDPDVFYEAVAGHVADMGAAAERSVLPDEPDREQVTGYLVMLRAAQARHLVGW